MISHNFHVKVYYKDIDQMGIVYYSRYFEFFELARTELLKSIGFAVKDIEKNDLFLPVISASCEYIKSASFEDKLIIESQIIKTPSARLQIDYNIISDNISLTSKLGQKDAMYISIIQQLIQRIEV